jgi:transposase
MRPYSEDLRERIVEAHGAGEGSVRELAKRFAVDPGTVQNYLTLKRETGDVRPRPHGGGTEPKLDAAGVQLVGTVVQEKNDRTHAEIAKELEARIHVKVSRATVWRALKRLGITRKKRRLVRASRLGPKSSRSVQPSSGSSSGWTRSASSSSTNSA